MYISIEIRGVNTVPYRLVRPVYTIPASKLVRLTPLFRTGKNTGCTGRTVNFGQYQLVLGVLAGTKKKKVFFYYYYFLSFVIFEFLLGQNGNLFALTY